MPVKGGTTEKVKAQEKPRKDRNKNRNSDQTIIHRSKEDYHG